MIFVVTYKGQIESLFFHFWDAQQHVNFFDKEEHSQMEIIKIDEQEVKELQELKEILENCNKIDTHNNHCCGNCALTFWHKSMLLCRFTQEEVNPNDYCTHYT